MRYKHSFRFKVTNNQGKDYVFVSKAKVIAAREPVALRLAADDVKKSMSLRGVGNTQTCSMAVCALRQADKFPHPVEGYIDWQYSRAYVVSKVDRFGRPAQCYVYRHDDTIAKINDTKGGQKKLLRQLLAKGDRIIHLRPVKVRQDPVYKPAGRNDGSRSPKTVTVRGAKLRFAMAQLGAV